ncbi:hypothetical protein EVAR_49899_1 [Eumeta japonica]|uniref:Uncharacterized protein n=1 Tax=Eumeta variegata TaxID=151549 RepID=A0A4C1Y536_EUMVA|nr:hypothetical protein EVAR_49899_1 [Eumeta japonica]
MHERRRGFLRVKRIIDTRGDASATLLIAAKSDTCRGPDAADAPEPLGARPDSSGRSFKRFPCYGRRRRPSPAKLRCRSRAKSTLKRPAPVPKATLNNGRRGRSPGGRDDRKNHSTCVTSPPAAPPPPGRPPLRLGP